MLIFGDTEVKKIALLMLAAALCGCDRQSVPAGKGGAVKVIERADGFEILDGSEKVLFYQLKAKSLGGKLERLNYIHPLYNLDGEVITEDFPEDHKHHRGIFWAWHQLYIGERQVGDGWALTDFSQQVISAKILKTGADSAAVKTEVLWKSPLWVDERGAEKPIVKVTSVVRVHRAERDIRKIDFEISLLGLEENMRIGGSEDVKGYGGFSTRIKLRDGFNFVGEIGEVEPVTNQVAGGGWMDISGRYGEDERLSGIAILCHKSNPVYPSRWILRRKNSCQNAVYPGQDAVALSNKKATVLRYRLILHRGDVDRVDIDKLQKEYNAGY